jgi:hypothetical protein
MQKILKRECQHRSFNKLFAAGVYEICSIPLLQRVDSHAEYHIARADNLEALQKYKTAYTPTPEFYVYSGFFAAKKISQSLDLNSAETFVYKFLRGAAQSDDTAWHHYIFERVAEQNEDSFLKFLFDYKKYGSIRQFFMSRTIDYIFYPMEFVMENLTEQAVRCIMIVMPAEEILKKIFNYLSTVITNELEYLECVDCLGLSAQYVARMAHYYRLNYMEQYYRKSGEK